MKYYKFNYHANHMQHYGELWALSQYDVQRHIVAMHSNATGIYIWVAV